MHVQEITKRVCWRIFTFLVNGSKCNISQKKKKVFWFCCGRHYIPRNGALKLPCPASRAQKTASHHPSGTTAESVWSSRQRRTVNLKTNVIQVFHSASKSRILRGGNIRLLGLGKNQHQARVKGQHISRRTWDSVVHIVSSDLQWEKKMYYRISESGYLDTENIQTRERKTNLGIAESMCPPNRNTAALTSPVKANEIAKLENLEISCIRTDSFQTLV